MSGLPKKTLFKCTTSLSINERFTQLRGSTEQATVHQTRENAIRANNALIHQASIKNRRLAQQMERRPTVMAALKIKKKSIRQRLGPLDNGGFVQDRLLLPSGRGLVHNRARGRGLGRGALLRGRTGLQGRVSVLASPRGIRSFVQRNRGGASLRQPQRNLETRQHRTQLLGQIRESRLGIQRGRTRGRGLRGQPRTSLPHGGQLRTNQLGARLGGSGLRGSGLRGSGLRGSGLRGSGLRSSGLRTAGLQGGGFRSSGLRSGLQSSGLRGSGLRSRGVRSGLRGSGLRRGLQSSGFRSSGLRSGLQSSGLRGSGLRGSGFRSGGLRSGLQSSGLRGSGLRGSGLRGSGLRRGGFRDSVQPRGNYRGNVQHRGQMRGGVGQRTQQQGGGYQRGVRGVHGGNQRFRGNHQNNQRVSFRGFGRSEFNQTKPSKEELDNELDQYMSNSESYTRRDTSISWH